MMGTFAHLKSFPFFNEPANWFLPFHADYSEFTGDSSALMQPEPVDVLHLFVKQVLALSPGNIERCRLQFGQLVALRLEL